MNLSHESKIKLIRELAVAHSDDEIIQLTGYSAALISQATEKMSGKWWGRNVKTGESITGRSAKSIYRAVCQKGWTTWDWGTGKVGENPQP